MRIGFIGLGKMGSQMVKRIIDAGHEVVVSDVNTEAVQAMVAIGAVASVDTQDMVNKLGDSAVVWVMIPHEFVTTTLDALALSLSQGSIVIDGGNSDYRDTLKHRENLQTNGIELVDVGTSGGIHGLVHGFSMMVGGSTDAVAVIDPILQSLAQTGGYGHFGRTGAGHYTKMVHNGIEYGAMQALAEGYRLIKEGPFENVDLAKLASVWQHGSINESFLNGLVEQMLTVDPDFEGVEGYVKESGEARWTLESAKEQGIDMPVTQAAFDVRIASQNGTTNYATKFLARLRNEFGGHAINKEVKK